jgi:iron complex transport system substrate-binding protein
VSLIPSVTELVFALGEGHRLVGRSHWCDWPPEARALPDLGRFESFSKERIVDLRPDLVIVFRAQEAMAKSLREDFGIPTLTAMTESRAEVFDGIEQVAGALGVPEKGRELVQRLKDGLEDVRRDCAAKPRVRALVVFDRNPLYVPGPRSFVDDLLEIVHAENVARSLETKSAWPVASLESVIDWDPEVIVDLSVGEDRERAIADGRRFWERYPALRAVREQRVRFLDAVLLVRPGPRMVEAARLLAGVVHGA